MSDEIDLTPKVDSPLAPDPYTSTAISAELPYINAKFHPAMLTGQKEKFVHYIISGMSLGAASTAVGTTANIGGKWLNEPLIVQALEYFREKNREKLKFSMETAHEMYLDTYRLAEAKEDPIAMKNVVDSLVKLHGIAAAPKVQQIEVNITNKKQAERLSDDKLLEQAGLDPEYLTPIPKRRAPPEDIVEGTYEEVPTSDPS
jgi:UDP:flavonoid glycosyltransferase YjiC (YdhE family)